MYFVPEMDDVTRKWIERAVYDLSTAQGLVKIRKYLYAAFMCQQAIEKLLKAGLSRQGKALHPIHNLLRLAEECNILEECEEFDGGLLAELTPYCIKARYGEYKRRLSELCDRNTAVKLLRRTERLFKWLRKKIGEQK